MPKVQYLGPYDRREVDAVDLGRETPEGGETERLVWVKEGASVELSDEEFEKLKQLTNRLDWAIEEAQPDAIDESSGQPDQAQSPPQGPEEVGNQPPG
jgi:hypothetical protein